MTLADWSINFSSGIPVYRQIMNRIYLEIGRGKLREGDRLPTIRELTEQLKINPNTVAKAYRELDLKGVLVGKRGNGSFVASEDSIHPKLTGIQLKDRLDEIFGRIIAEFRAE